MRPEAIQGFAGQHAMVQQTALVAANMIASAAGQAAPAGLPGSQIFAAAKKADAAGSSQLQHLMNRFDASDASASASTTPVAGSGAVKAEPRMLALEDRPAMPASSVPCKSAGADLEEKMPLMQAEAKEEGGAAPPPGGELEQTLAALAHAQKELPERLGSTASVAESPSKAKSLKRPASVLRKPSACKSSLDHAVAKRPAATQIGRKEYIDGKQKAHAVKANRKKAGGIKKKVSAVKASPGKSHESKKAAGPLQTISRKVAAKKYPNGCSRCRHSAQAAGHAGISS